MTAAEPTDLFIRRTGPAGQPSRRRSRTGQTRRRGGGRFSARSEGFLPDAAGHHTSELSPPIRELIQCVERLAEIARELTIADSNQPPDLKLGQLCTQLAAALHWAEQIRCGTTDTPPSHAKRPHWQSARGRQPGENRSV